MKKTIGAMIFLFALLFCFPCGARAANSGSNVIDMRGTRTYLGTAADWAKPWDASKFTDVTGKDVNCDGDLTVKAGLVKSIDAESGSVTFTGGTALNVGAFGDITISGGTVRGNVDSGGGNIVFNGNLGIGGTLNAAQSVTFSSGKVTVGGSVRAAYVTFNSGVGASIAGNVTGYGTIKIGDCTLRAGSLDSVSAGELEITGYKGALPKLVNTADIVVDENVRVVCRQPLQAHSLSLKHGSEFVGYGEVTLDTLDGPGTLCVSPGALTVHYNITDLPTLVFNAPAGNGATAFQSDGWSISTSAVTVYGYDLVESSSGSHNVYRLDSSGYPGLAFDTHSVSLGDKGSATIRVEVAPGISQYADGTKIVWELHGDSAGITMSAADKTCNVSSNGTASGSHRAVVAAYLVDRNGTYLSGYRADSCIVTQSTGSDYKLDTTTVSVLSGGRYGILAMGGNGVKPAASSSDGSIATLGAGQETTDKSGNKAWLFTVTGGKSGAATIDIGGQKVAVSVNSGILIDTLSYSMSPRAKYCIGLTPSGISESGMSVYSTNPCVQVKFLRKESSGKLLYQISGVSVGTSDIVFQVTGGQSVETSVTVENGSKSYGKTARLVALKQ